MSYRIPKDCSSIRKALAEKVILFQSEIIVPDKEMWIQSFLEPVHRRGGGEGLGRLTLGKRVSWNPAEMGKT